MSDAEGIRNLVGTGLVQLVGGLVTAVMGLGVLFWLNWHLTAITILVLAAFGGGMAYAFRTLRPLFRERGKINAEVTGRLTEALGGIRVVKSYTAEKREEIVFTKGAHKLFRNIAKSMTGVSATTAGSTVIVGIVGVLMIWLGGNAILAGEMTLGELVMYIFFIGLVAAPLVSIASIGTQITEAFAGLDRIREILDMPTEVEEDERRSPVARLNGDLDLRGRVVRVQRRVNRFCGECRFTPARERRRRWSDPVAPERARSSASSWRSTDRRKAVSWWTAAICWTYVSWTIAASWRRCCRRTFSSTAQSWITSDTPNRARLETKSSRRAGSHIAMSSSVSFPRDTTPS